MRILELISPIGGAGESQRRQPENNRRRTPRADTAALVLAAAGLIATTMFAGVSQTCSAAAPIKTMSFNIRFDNGVPSNNSNAWISPTGVNRRDLAISVVNDFAPDILGVQEAMSNQVADLSGALTQHDFYGVGRDDGATSGEYSGIFYRRDRFTRTGEGTFWLSNSPDSPSYFPGTCCRRIASWAVLADAEVDGQEYFVLNTHWDHQVESAREHSAELIRARINLLADDRPVIVMGDLNATEPTDAVQDLIGDNDPTGFQLVDAFRAVMPERTQEEASFNGFTGRIRGARIDYVLHSSFFLPIDASIVRTDIDGKYPSDHYPVTATLLPIPEPRSLSLLLGSTLTLLARRRVGRAAG